MRGLDREHTVVGELIAGRYELEQRLGSGGMAEVFCASDRLLERRVAVKVLHERWSRDPDLVERFRREARTAARLSHPNIVTAIDRGEWRGRPYIVLEYIEGTNLKQLVLGERQVPIRDALELAVQIGRGLGYAHRHGVVHRDVKPQNVLLGVGEAKVTDFGVALSSDLDELTLTGSIVGRSDYLAPEQADGRAADERSDVYSLGVVVFELLTGAPPFSGDSFLDVALQHLSQPAPSVLERRPDTPPRIAAAVARALAKVPGSRFQSMDEFVAELEACRADGDPSDGATMIHEPPRWDTFGHRPRNRRRLLVSAAALALLAAAAVIGVPFLPSQSHPRALAAAATRLRTVAAYDPSPGDGVEDNQRLPLATTTPSPTGTPSGTQTSTSGT